MKLNNNFHLVIPASGIGSRFGSDIPKQYTLMKNGKSILDTTISAFINNKHIDNIVITLHKNDEFFTQSNFYNHHKITTIIGGKERFHSVQNAVKYLAKIVSENDFIAVHDSVRPCITRSDIDNLFQKIDNHKIGGLLAVKAFDTLKSYNNQTLKTIDREYMYHALTPQVYRLGILQKSLQHAVDDNIAITDDASSIEEFGQQGMLVEGSKNNIKITTPEDLQLANLILDL